MSQLLRLDPNFQEELVIPDVGVEGESVLFQTVERFNNRNVEVLTVVEVSDDDDADA